MSIWPRTDRSWLATWSRTVDHVTFGAIAVLMGFGTVLIATAGPAVAQLYDAPYFHYLVKHAIFLPPAIALLVGGALLNPTQVFQVGTLVCIGALVLTVATLFLGTEIKGASRWLSLGVVTIQPSEFLRPGMAVLSAWLFARHRIVEGSRAHLVAICLMMAVGALLMAQPDLGMTVAIAAVWLGQFVLAGLSLAILFPAMLALVLGGVGAYFMLPHVHSRVAVFLGEGDRYQIEKSLNAFREGGLVGRGPGEGVIKERLPDAHADFIFAVAGEEFGLIVCLALVAVYGLIVCRGALRLMTEENLFAFLAVAGLLAGFGLQAFVNMASALELVPSKGMTLPFLSYGGSSMLAVSLSLGLVLALNRRRDGRGEVL